MGKTVDDADLAVRLKRERQQRQWNQQRVAELLGIDQAQVSRIENGQRRVSSIELARLAEAFGMPVADLLDERPLSDVMRSAARSDGAHVTSLADQATGIARLARTLATAGFELPQNRLALALPSRGRMVDQGRRLAEELRHELGLGSAPVETIDLVRMMEDTGLVCWLGSYRGEGDGLYLRDEACAIAVVNVADRPSVRVRFTVAHEWGHHLFGDGVEGFCDDIDVYRSNAGLSEMRANAFAANLLLPASTLNEVMSLSPNVLADLAGRYGVSGETVYYQAKNLDLLPGDLRQVQSPPADVCPPLRSNVLQRLVIAAFNRRKLGSAPTEWVLGRELTDTEFDSGIKDPAS